MRVLILIVGHVVVMTLVKGFVATHQRLEEIRIGFLVSVAVIIFAGVILSIIVIAIIVVIAIVIVIVMAAVVIIVIAVIMIAAVIAMAVMILVIPIITVITVIVGVGLCRGAFFKTGEVIVDFIAGLRGDGGFDDHLFGIDVGIVSRHLLAGLGEVIFEGCGVGVATDGDVGIHRAIGVEIDVEGYSGRIGRDVGPACARRSA